MSLVLTLYPDGDDNDVYVGDVQLIAENRQSLGEFTLKFADTGEVAAHVTTDQAEEVLPNVLVHGGTGFDDGDSVCLCISAPRDVRVLRGKLYRENNAVI